MTKLLREFRLIPVVLIAVTCLFVLKFLGLVLDGGYTLGQRLGSAETLVVTTVPMSSTAQLRPQTTPLNIPSTSASGSGKSWMRDNFYPEVTGSVPSTPPASKDAKAQGTTEAKPAAAPSGSAPDARSGGTKVALDAPPRPVSAAERALLERLQERRQELDARSRELDARESLLTAAEKKLEPKPGESKTGDGKGGAGGRKDDPDARFKGVVTMYETMKPKEAAKIFDRLDIRILIDVASQINPRVMSAILAQMSPEAAERLTVELATRGSDAERTVNPNDLPKIEGRPNN
jgi:flagellar motility protein MotE (MotC chaperone)